MCAQSTASEPVNEGVWVDQVHIEVDAFHPAPRALKFLGLNRQVEDGVFMYVPDLLR